MMLAIWGAYYVLVFIACATLGDIGRACYMRATYRKRLARVVHEVARASAENPQLGVVSIEVARWRDHVRVRFEQAAA